MAGAPLIGIHSSHSIDQRIDVGLVAIRQEKILPNHYARLGEFSRDVLIHQTVPYLTK
jgi:hypothetical protein